MSIHLNSATDCYMLSEQFFYFNWVMLGCRQYKMMEYMTWCVLEGGQSWERNEALQNSNSTAIICYDTHIKRLLLCSLLFAFVYYIIIWQRQARNNVKWKHFLVVSKLSSSLTLLRVFFHSLFLYFSLA